MFGALSIFEQLTQPILALYEQVIPFGAKRPLILDVFDRIPIPKSVSEYVYAGVLKTRDHNIGSPESAAAHFCRRSILVFVQTRKYWMSTREMPSGDCVVKFIYRQYNCINNGNLGIYTPLQATHLVPCTCGTVGPLRL